MAREQEEQLVTGARATERVPHAPVVRVAVDAMGGDNAPHEIVLGAVQAAQKDAGLAIRLVGKAEALETELTACLAQADADVRSRVSSLIANEVVEMDDHAAASVRRKQDSSIRVAARLVADGKADAVVSAGNSGGVMAAAIFELKRIPGLERPAIGTLIPGKTGYTFMLDAGANADVKPEWLAQFALLGDAYGRRLMGIEKPRIGLLSNGEEATKGNALTVEAHGLLKHLPINFAGNVEGKNLFDGSVDVVVTDGFTGNVALKTIEGVAEFLLTTIRDEAKKSVRGMAGGLLLKPSIGNIRARADWRQIGGAPLLGVNGVCIIAHGRSDAEATKNAIIRGAEAVRGGLVEAMTDAIGASYPAAGREDAADGTAELSAVGYLGEGRGGIVSNDKPRVVITGMGTVNPIANDVDAFYDALVEGKSGIAPLQGYPTENITSKIAGQIKNLDISEHLGAKEIRRTARFSQIAIIAARQAVAQAGLSLQGSVDGTPDGVDRDRVGVVNGTSLGSFTDTYQQVESGGPTHERISPFFVSRMLPNMAGASLAMEFGFRGHNDTSVTACAASTQAIGNALRVLQYGDADAVLTGGTEANLSDWGISLFCAMKALTTHNEEPEKASRPFDLNRDGFVGAEGAGYLFLETEEHALARGATVIAEVAGFASTDDAYHQVMPEDSGYGAALAMERALRDANVAPDEVGYVNAHGTSTQLNDKAETAAIKKALGAHAQKVAISSTKSMIGHTLGAAGGVEAVATVLGLTRGTLHPTINYETPDPDCDLDYIPNQARQADVDIAMSNSFGFGGQNACLVFKRYEA